MLQFWRPEFFNGSFRVDAEGHSPSVGSRGPSVFCPFWLLEIACIPWLPDHIIPDSLQHQDPLTLTCLLFLCTDKDPGDHIDPNQVVQVNILISKFLTVIMSAESLPPCKVTQSQVCGDRVWIFVGREGTLYDLLYQCLFFFNFQQLQY